MNKIEAALLNNPKFEKALHNPYRKHNIALKIRGKTDDETKIIILFARRKTALRTKKYLLQQPALQNYKILIDTYINYENDFEPCKIIINQNASVAEIIKYLLSE